MTKKFTSAGLLSAFYSFLDADGYAIGAATSLANGGDSGAVEVDGIDAFDFTVQQPRIVNTTGNDGPIGIFVFQPDSNPQGTMTLGSANSDLMALAMTNKVYAVGTDFDAVPFQPFDWLLKDLAIITNSQAQSRDSGSVGNAGYYVQVFNKLNLIPTGPSGLRNAQASSFGHTLVGKQSDKWPTGKALSATDEGTTKAVGFGFFSPNPVTMHSFKGDGADVAITLDKTPAAADGVKTLVYQNGTKLVYGAGAGKYEVVVATKVLTFGTAPGAGDDVVVLYQYTI